MISVFVNEQRRYIVVRSCVPPLHTQPASATDFSVEGKGSARCGTGERAVEVSGAVAASLPRTDR